jgi:hypothetical protein
MIIRFHSRVLIRKFPWENFLDSVFENFLGENFLHGMCVLKKNSGFAYSPLIVRVMASMASPMISCWSCRSMR